VRGKTGRGARADIEVGATSADSFYAVVVPGGWRRASCAAPEAVTDLLRDAYDQGKIVGRICPAGLVGISAGIVEARRVAGRLGIKDDLVNAAAIGWAGQRSGTASSCAPAVARTSPISAGTGHRHRDNIDAVSP
jgi:protease I